MKHCETRDFSDSGSEIVQQASPLVSCFWCERLHPGEHPLAVCPACAEWRNYDAFGGSHGLDNETQPASAAA